jgi:hypothetical protein
MRRRFWVGVAVVIVLVAVAVALGIYLSTRVNERTSPPILNKPTDARRVRTLHRGPEPGIPKPPLRREQHSKDE